VAEPRHAAHFTATEAAHFTAVEATHFTAAEAAHPTAMEAAGAETTGAAESAGENGRPGDDHHQQRAQSHCHHLEVHRGLLGEFGDGEEVAWPGSLS